MGELLQRLWDWLLSKDPASASPTFGNPELHPIDTEKLAKELDVEREAARLGKGNVPPTDARTPSGVEFKIIQVIEKARQDYAHWSIARVGDLNRTIAGTDLGPNSAKVLQLDSEFERKAGSMFNEWRSILTRLTKDIEDLSSEYVTFQKDNHLTYPAKMPTDAQRHFRHVVLIALVLIEGGLNSVFFAQGLWGGYVEGLFYAVMFAGVNIAFAYAYGRFLVPQIFHRSILRKVAGTILIACALAAIVALGFLIAHYRDAVTGGAAEAAARIAWETVRETPLELRDAQSVLLCGVSILFALIAIYDAVGLDDPYPGYGDITRRRDLALDDHEAELAAVWEQLETLKIEWLKELDAIVDRMRTGLHQLGRAIEQKAGTETILNNAFVNVDNCLDALLAKFRDGNRLHRSTPAPDYFNERPVLRAVTRPDFSTALDGAKYESQKIKLQEAEAGIPTVRANIQSSYSRLFDKLKPLDEHFKQAVANNQ